MKAKIAVHSGTSVAAANRIFNEMRRLTASLFNLKSSATVCSIGRRKRWRDLANIWTKYGQYEYTPFDLAFHKIYWGVYPEPMKDEWIPLVTLVERELLSDGPAYKEWKKHISYKAAFSCMKELDKALVRRCRRPHSHIFASFQNARFWFKVVYKEKKPGLINPSKASVQDMMAAKTHADICDLHDGFVKVINCLIPASSAWNDEQWLNDLNIRRELKKLYNVKYVDYDKDFEILVEALIKKLHYNSSLYLAELLRLSSLPMGIAEQIWPGQTNIELKKLFLRAASQAKAAETRIRNGTSRRYGVHSYLKLRSSWLYQYTYNEVTAREPNNKFESHLKKKVYEVTAGI